MRHDTSDGLWAKEPLLDARHKDVRISYRCDALTDYESLHLVKDLVDSAVELLLNKTCLTAGERPIRICVEHCQKRCLSDTPLGDLRYLKVYVEGHAPCIVMAY